MKKYNSFLSLLYILKTFTNSGFLKLQSIKNIQGKDIGKKRVYLIITFYLRKLRTVQCYVVYQMSKILKFTYSDNEFMYVWFSIEK